MWDYKNIDYLYNNYSLGDDASICKELDVTKTAISAEVEKLHLRRCGRFTEEELNTAERYGSSLGTALIFLMPQRSVPEVRQLLMQVP